MRELNIISNSTKMAPENVDKTKNANKVTFFRSEKNTENPSDRFSKRKQTPCLRKTQSLLVLRTKQDVGISSSSSVLTSQKTPDAYGDDVTSIASSSVSTSSSSDGRGRSIRRRLPPLPRHEPGTAAAMALREGRRHRQQQQQQQQQQQRRCTETDLLLVPVEREAKTDRQMADDSTCRLRANHEEETCAPGRPRTEVGLLRPVPLRPDSDRSSRLSIGPVDEDRRSEEDATLSRRTFQLETTASKRHLVSKTTPKEILDKNRDERESHSLEFPFFLPLNHRISSVDSEDDEETDDEVNSPTTKDHFSSGNAAPKSNAMKAEPHGKAPHPVQNYLETAYLMRPKTQDVSTEKEDHSKSSALNAEILERKESVRSGERQKGRSFQRMDYNNRTPSVHDSKTLEATNRNGGDRDTSSAVTSSAVTSSAVTSEEEDDDVTQMRLSKTGESGDENVSNGSRENSQVEWERNVIFQSSSFPQPPPPSLHLLLQNYLPIPVTLFGSHPGNDLGMTFAKKQLLWRHFTETLGGAFRPVATNENGSLLLGVVMVTHVAKGTPAEANGLTVGDIVVELNGIDVLRSSADDVRRLLTSSGRRVDLVLARSRASLHQMAERSFYRWEENSGEVSTTSKVRPQLKNNFHRKEFPAKLPQRFDKDDESSMKQQRYPMKKQKNREQRLLAEDNSRFSMHNGPEEQNSIRHSMDDDYPPNELFDPDFGWQKISAV